MDSALPPIPPITHHAHRPRIGLALGSGSARGMAHIGVIQALTRAGIEPDIVTGTSIGALVAAAYLAEDGLLRFEAWAKSLRPREVLHFLDVRLLAGSGLAGADTLIEHLRELIGDYRMEDAPKALAFVATDLLLGNEVWLREGSVWDAVRASIALPGILTPAQDGQRWLVDGGLLNPVPVSVCKALGADLVIAVNLNGDIVSRHLHQTAELEADEHETDKTDSLLQRLSGRVRQGSSQMLQDWLNREPDQPGLVDVLSISLNIMQDRITRSRLAGDPAHVLIEPHLAHIGLLDFTHTQEAIEEGRAAVERALPSLRHALGRVQS